MKTDIENRLSQDYTFLESEGYEIFCLFLFGSQNYKTDNKKSDIDVRAIIVPSFQQLVHKNSEITREYDFPTGKLCIMDIDSFVKNLKKQNPNFLECLFTRYYKVNPLYAHEFNELITMRENISRINVWRGATASLGIIRKRAESIFKENNVNKNRILSHGCDYKALSETLRMLDQLEDFLDGSTYESLQVSKRYRELAKIKKDGVYAKEAVDILKNEINPKIIELDTKINKLSDQVNDPVTIFKVDHITETIVLEFLKSSRAYR